MIPVAAVDVILVSVGVNDVTSLMRRSRWRRNLDDLLRALHAHSPGAVIAVAGIPPLRVFPLLPQPLRSVIGYRGESLDRETRKLIRAHPRALHVPIQFEAHTDRFGTDGFHPSEISYSEFGHAIAVQLVSRLSKQ